MDLLFNHAPIPISSGRISLKYIARFCRFNRYETKILIPYYLSNCILDTICKYAYPVTDTRNDHNALFVYHQFGYRQVDSVFEYGEGRNLVIIEDCANIIEYSNIRGDFAFFSLSKFFNISGGILLSRHLSFYNFVKNMQSTRLGFLLFFFIKMSKKLTLKSEILTSIMYSLYQFIDYFPIIYTDKLVIDDDILDLCRELGIKYPPYKFMFYRVNQSDSSKFENYWFDLRRDMLNPLFRRLPAISFERLVEDKTLINVIKRNKDTFITDGLSKLDD